MLWLRGREGMYRTEIMWNVLLQGKVTLKFLLMCYVSEFTLTICGRRSLRQLYPDMQPSEMLQQQTHRICGRIKQSCWVICQIKPGGGGKSVALSHCDKIPLFIWTFTAAILSLHATIPCARMAKARFSSL